MRKIFFLVAFLSASIMSFAYTAAPGAWIGSTDAAYANQFKWSEVEGVATPTDVVNIQKPGFAGEIGIYVTFADAAFNAVYFNGVLVANEAQYKQDGAGAVFYLSALTAKNTEILIKNGETVRFGLNVYNDKGETGELDSDIDSEYCGEVMSSGNTTAAFTWETKADGSVVITISEALGGDDAATHFRGNGISIGREPCVCHECFLYVSAYASCKMHDVCTSVCSSGKRRIPGEGKGGICTAMADVTARSLYVRIL